GRNAEVTGKGNDASTVNAGRFGASTLSNYTGSADFGGLSDDGRHADPIQLRSPDTSGVESMSGETKNDTPDNPELGKVRDISLANLHTNAYIDDGAWVSARGNVEVKAQAHEDLMSLAFAVGGGFVGVALPNSVMVVNSSTHAYIGNDAGTDAAGAKVDAQGSVLVSAKVDSDAFVIVGSVAGGAVGVGGAVSVLLLDKDTSASVG